MAVEWHLAKEWPEGDEKTGEHFAFMSSALNQLCELIHGGSLSKPVVEKYASMHVDNNSPLKEIRVFLFKKEPVVMFTTFKNKAGEKEMNQVCVRLVSSLNLPARQKISKREREKFNQAKRNGKGNVVNAMRAIKKRIVH